MHDDYRVTSELYRLMPPRKRAGSGELGEAPICAWTRPIRPAVRAAQIQMICAFKRASPGSSPTLVIGREIVRAKDKVPVYSGA